MNLNLFEQFGWTKVFFACECQKFALLTNKKLIGNIFLHWGDRDCLRDRATVCIYKTILIENLS
jgi:hypothetical protein